MSVTDLARRLGVTIETVSRWEHDAHPIRGPAERLLRLLVALKLGIGVPRLECIGTARAEEIAVRLAWDGNAWEVVA